MKKIFFNKRNKIELKESHITSHVDIDWSVFAAIRLFHFQASLLHHSIDWLAHCSPAEFICFHLLLSPVVSSSLIVRSCYGHCIIIALHNIRNWLLMMHQKLQILIKTFFFLFNFGNFFISQSLINIWGWCRGTERWVAANWRSAQFNPIKFTFWGTFPIRISSSESSLLMFSSFFGFLARRAGRLEEVPADEVASSLWPAVREISRSSKVSVDGYFIPT